MYRQPAGKTARSLCGTGVAAEQDGCAPIRHGRGAIGRWRNIRHSPVRASLTSFYRDAT
ncbi:hypothetical protein LC55x_3756 [Lysobacter capsici]|nr:hypothetical protein LC55x_3756 [Lysobacter capsici]